LDVGQGIAVETDQVRHVPRLDGAGVRQAKGASGTGRGGGEALVRTQSAVDHAHELQRVRPRWPAVKAHRQGHAGAVGGLQRAIRLLALAFGLLDKSRREEVRKTLANVVE